VAKIPFKSEDGKKGYVEEGTPRARCEKHPAGHPVQLKDGRQACLFLYNEDGSPVKGYDNIENITLEEEELAVETESGKEKFET